MLHVTLCHEPIDRLDVDILTLGFFSSERPLRRSAALIDWRMNGEISKLLLSDWLQGKRNEATLLPSMKRLKAPRLMLYGLGHHRDWGSDRAERTLKNWVHKLYSLNVKRWGFSLDTFSSDFVNWRFNLRALIHHVDAMREENESIQLIISDREEWIREAKRRQMDFGEWITVHYGFIKKSPEQAESLVPQVTNFVT